MKIVKNSVVTLKYRLTDAQGEFIEETDEPVEYLHGGYDGIFPRVEEALEGHEVGYKTTLQRSASTTPTRSASRPARSSRSRSRWSCASRVSRRTRRRSRRS